MIRFTSHSRLLAWRLAVVLGGLGIILGSALIARAVIGRQQGGSAGSSGYAFRQPAAVNNGLVAWYPLDGDAKDLSKNANNGTLTNFTFDGSTNGWIDGKFGKGLQFNGSNTTVDAPSTSSLNAYPLTVSAWIKTTQNGSQSGIVNKYITGSSNGYQVFLAGGVVKAWYFSPPSSNVYTNGLVTNSQVVNDGAWHSIVFVVDATGGVLYVDGVAGSTVAWTGTPGPPTTTKALTLGNYSAGTPFNGSIDDVRIYNRALSTAEIAQLYQGSRPTNCDQTCIGWWKLDEASGIIAADSSGNGNDGTLSNFTFVPASDGWTSGVFGNGLKFKSSASQYVTVSPSTSLDTTFSVEFWANLPSLPCCSKYNIIGGGTDRTGGKYPVNIGIGGNSGTPYFEAPFGITGSQVSYPFQASTWYHLAVTFAAPHTIKLYVNGAMVYSRTAAYLGGNVPALYDSTHPFVVGRIGSGASYLNGSIDDVRVYNRTLTDSEIAEQYQAGR